MQCSLCCSLSELVSAFFSWRGGLWGGYNFCGPRATPWTLTKDRDIALFFIARDAILVAWWASSLPMQSSREALLIPLSFPTHQAINSRLGELCRFRKFPSLDSRSTRIRA